MPEYIEIVCDNCGAAHKRERDKATPEEWFVKGWVICGECWLNIKGMLRPAVSSVQESMPKLFEHLEDQSKKPRVAMSILVYALEEMRRIRQSDIACEEKAEAVS
jgi:hypothetical protein